MIECRLLDQHRNFSTGRRDGRLPALPTVVLIVKSISTLLLISRIDETSLLNGMSIMSEQVRNSQGVQDMPSVHGVVHAQPLQAFVRRPTFGKPLRGSHAAFNDDFHIFCAACIIN